MTDLITKLDALESALKHQPGKHPQSKHAGGRGGANIGNLTDSLAAEFGSAMEPADDAGRYHLTKDHQPFSKTVKDGMANVGYRLLGSSEQSGIPTYTYTPEKLTGDRIDIKLQSGRGGGTTALFTDKSGNVIVPE